MITKEILETWIGSEARNLLLRILVFAPHFPVFRPSSVFLNQTSLFQTRQYAGRMSEKKQVVGENEEQEHDDPGVGLGGGSGLQEQ